MNREEVRGRIQDISFDAFFGVKRKIEFFPDVEREFFFDTHYVKTVDKIEDHILFLIFTFIDSPVKDSVIKKLKRVIVFGSKNSTNMNILYFPASQ